jgi:hypothetical protein
MVFVFDLIVRVKMTGLLVRQSPGRGRSSLRAVETYS